MHESDGRWTFTRASRQVLTFDGTGRLSALSDLNGEVTSLTYGTSGRLERVTDPAGRSLSLAYAGSRLASVTDPASPPRVVRFSYDGTGNLTEVTDAGGGRTTFGYDASRRLVTKRLPKHFGVVATLPPRSPTATTPRAASRAKAMPSGGSRP